MKAEQRQHRLFHPIPLLYEEGRNQWYVPGSEKKIQKSNNDGEVMINKFYIVIDIFLQCIVVIGMHRFQMEHKIDIVPHVVIIKNMIMKTL